MARQVGSLARASRITLSSVAINDCHPRRMTFRINETTDRPNASECDVKADRMADRDSHAPAGARDAPSECTHRHADTFRAFSSAYREHVNEA